MHDRKLEEAQVLPFYNELIRVKGQLNELWQASSICCNTGCSGYWRPINRDCAKHGMRLRDCWQCENEAELAAATSLVDGVYNIVELWDAKTPSQIEWKKWWMNTARAIGASAD